jgi:hypothetical protein
MDDRSQTVHPSISFVVGARFQFLATDRPLRLLYGLHSLGDGLGCTIDDSVVEWTEITDSSEFINRWTESRDGGAEGRWFRHRVTVLDRRAYDLDGLDLTWTVMTIEDQRDHVFLKDNDAIWVEAETNHPRTGIRVRCRFFLGDRLQQRGGRPLSSIALVSQERGG